MMIELSGTPGAGKSHLCEHTLVPELNGSDDRPVVVIDAEVAEEPELWSRPMLALPDQLGRPVRWRLHQRRRRNLFERFRARHPELVELVESHQARRPDAAYVTERNVIDHWQKACADFELSQDRDDLTFVANEGLIHRVVQLFSSAVEPVPHDLVAEYCGLVPLPDRLHYVVAPPDVCVARLQRRGLWHPWTSVRELEIFVQNAAEASALAASVVKDRGLEVHTVENSKPQVVEP